MAEKKPAERRRRRNKKPTAKELDPQKAASSAGVPALPDSYQMNNGFDSVDVAFLPATRDWYERWTRSPQAAGLLDTDWDHFRFVIAPLFDRFLRGGSKELATELRLQLKDFGGTPAGRGTLDWKNPSAPREPSSTSGQKRYGHLRVVADDAASGQ